MTDIDAETAELLAEEMGVTPALAAFRLRLRHEQAISALERVMSWEETGIRFENPLTQAVTVADKERLWGKPKPGTKRKSDPKKKAGKVLYSPKARY